MTISFWWGNEGKRHNLFPHRSNLKRSNDDVKPHRIPNPNQRSLKCVVFCTMPYLSGIESNTLVRLMGGQLQHRWGIGIQSFGKYLNIRITPCWFLRQRKPERFHPRKVHIDISCFNLLDRLICVHTPCYFSFYCLFST